MYYPNLLDTCTIISSGEEIMYVGIFDGQYLFWGFDRYLFALPEEIENSDNAERSDSLALPIFPSVVVGDEIYKQGEHMKIIAIAPMLPPYTFDFHLILQSRNGELCKSFEQGYILPKYLDGTAWE